MSAPIAVLRAALFAVWFYGVTFAFCVAGVPIRIFARPLALPLAKYWARSVLAGLPPICNIRIVLTGWDNIPATGPALLAGQHQSEFDTLVWMALLDRPCYVMKEELTRVPLFGPLLVPSGMIPVNRSGGASAMRGMLKDTARAAENSRQIVIFPEGTRVPHGQRVPLQPGVAAVAARTKLAVLPVATDSGFCWPRELLGKRPGIIHISIGPPLPSTNREDLLAAVADYWTDLAACNYERPVDKTVGNTANQLA